MEHPRHNWIARRTEGDPIDNPQRRCVNSPYDGTIGGDRMKRLQTVWAGAVCVGIAGACHAAPSGTATLKPAKGFDISITRTEPDGQYLVNVQLKRMGRDGKTSETVASPKVLVLPGKSGRIVMGEAMRGGVREPEYMIEIVTPPDSGRHAIQTVKPDRSVNYPMQIRVYETPRE